VSPRYPASPVPSTKWTKPNLERYQFGLSPADQDQLVQTVARDLSLPQVSVFGYNPTILAFVTYIVLVVIGSSFYLITLGPHLRLGPYRPSSKRSRMPPVFVPTGNSGPAAPEPKTLRSLLFYNRIGQIAESDWSAHWETQSTEELEHEMRRNFVFEAHVLSVKLREKDQLMGYGSFFFRCALIALAGVPAGLFSWSMGWYWLTFSGTASFLALVYAITDHWRDREANWFHVRVWFMIALAFILAGALLAAGRLG
jgi:hypothetical protein